MGFLNKDQNDEQSRTNATGADDATDAFEAKAAEIEKLLEDTRDQLLRRTAEMENMRRRHQQEREQLIFEGNRRLILDLLSVVDDLERTLEHASKEKDPMAQGIELVHKNFLKTLERYGVRLMETEGQMFDPMKHDAMMQQPMTGVEPGTIVKEIQRGYLLQESVLRHAKVIVAREAD